MRDTSLAQILNDLTAETQTKTASSESEPTPTKAAESDKTAGARNELTEALKRAEAAVAAGTGTNKVASEANPVNDLTKIASDLASADHEALVKEAEFYGAAVADGFMARIGQYEEAAAQLSGASEKTASIDVEKIAAEAVRGYIDAKTELEKQAAAQTAQQEQGYNDTLNAVEKVASAVFEQGIADCQAILANSQ